MTISSTTRKAGPYVGNGVTTSFAFAFKVFTAADVVVTKTTVATGAESVLVLTTDYTVSLNADQNANPGGSVTYNPSGTPMASTHTLTLTSNVLQTQGTDIPSAGGWYPEVVENALDKSTILTQQITEVVNRTIRFPVSESGAVQLPAAAQRASKIIGFDANGDVTVYPASSTAYGVLRDYQVATAGQTVFNLGFAYSLGIFNLRVFVNGLLQRITADYTESSTSQVTFTYGLQANDEVEFFAGQETVGADGDASSVSYTPSGAGAVVSNVRDKLRESVSVKDFGAVGDSNGTTGNGTNDTAALQAAITHALLTGKRLHVPQGTYRFTAPLDFTGGTNQIVFEGDGNLKTILFADFTSVSKRGALNLKNTAGTRAYVHLRDFHLLGVSDANTIGIYCEYTSEFTQIQNVYVKSFYDGIRVAFDYAIKLIDVYCWYNTNNGLAVGYDLAGGNAGCNNVTVRGGIYTFNGANGIAVNGCRAISIDQADSSANDYANLNLTNCFSGTVDALYTEYSNGLAASPVYQVYVYNSYGVQINLSCSEWKAGQIIAELEDCNNCEVTATVELSGGGTRNGTGVYLLNSFGCKVHGHINNISTGVSLGNPSRARVDAAFGAAVTTTISSVAGSITLDWQEATPTAVTASSLSSQTLANIDYCTTRASLRIEDVKRFDVQVTQAQLAAAGTKKLITHTLPSEQWKVLEIFISPSTNFSGGGGDRAMKITDGTLTWSIIPAATLQAQVQARWGSTNVPYSATDWHWLQPTTAASDLYAAYSGGTTDYTTGGINVAIIAVRTA